MNLDLPMGDVTALVLALVALVNAIGTATALVITAMAGAQRPRTETHSVNGDAVEVKA